MSYLKEFDEIRPYFDNEVTEVIKRIVRERGFLNFVKTFFPEQSTKTIITDLLKVENIADFQRHLIYPIVERMIHGSITNLTFSGLENIRKDKAYIFLSNHRDIVLDSALLEYILVKNKHETTEIAIGSNLLILEWIVDLVRLNRSFIVKRDLPRIELYQYSVNLSKYIRYVITEQQDSIWLAQREGRTKDGNDQTQLSVLKMLNLSCEGSFFEGFKNLNILPLSISYEFEPLALEKVQQRYNKIINPEFKKTKLDDLTQMMGGIETPKGHVNYAFGTPLNQLIQNIEHITNRKEQYDALKQIIDNEIYKNYLLSANNYIATDLLQNSNTYENKYSKEQKEIFKDYFELSVMQLKGEKEVLREMFLNVYAMPLKNFLSINK